MNKKIYTRKEHWKHVHITIEDIFKYIDEHVRPTEFIYIIYSKTKYYLEYDTPFIRVGESVIFKGLAKTFVKKYKSNDFVIKL